MKRKTSIEALISKSRKDFLELKEAYQRSLQEKVIRDDLKVDIKNIFENLRSCLDYLANEMFENFCHQAAKPHFLYFPIRSSQQDFNKVMSRDYPNLQATNPNVFQFLDSIQPYNDPWLGRFNQLNNENKHQDLVEQTRTESKRVTVSALSGSSHVSWASGSVRFGGGVRVMGVPIDPNTQLPVANSTVTTQITTWVDFKFNATGGSVLPFIEESLNKTQQIWVELEKYISPSSVSATCAAIN